jgi:DNA-binding transcriptional MocR family regulator
MTSWSPNLAESTGPRYVAIADGLARDIAAGRLRAGDRLPTHRELAWKLGVTVGTVTRAYAEAERRGLIAGEVGRGTFIRDRTADVLPAAPNAPDGFIDLARNFPPHWRDNREIADILGDLSHANDLGPLLGYAPNLGLPAHREAGAQWLARSGIDVTPSQVALTNGAQHAMVVSLSALTRPGDVVLSEQLTFYGLKSLGTHLSLRLHGVETDEHGLVPAALDAACRQMAPKAIYCMPTLQNPTTATMPEERRREIAAICLRHGATIVEDDIYGFLVEDAPPALSSFAPDHSILLTSLSKCVAPGMRLGYVRANEALIERVAAALRATTWMATPLIGEIAARLIRSGKAARMATQMREEAKARQLVARRVLADAEYDAHEASFHVWLKLPEPWRREEFAAQVRRRGVGVAPADAFAIGRAQVPHAVRIGLSAARDRAQLERALTIVSEVLRDTPNSMPLV